MNPSPAAPDSNAAKKIVLVVDDNMDFSSYLSEVLRWWGFRTMVARSVDEAIDRLKEDRADMLIVDYMMPGATGVELYRRIKQESSYADTPVLFVSALGLSPSDPNAILMKRVGFLSKPVTPHRLREALNTAFPLPA